MSDHEVADSFNAVCERVRGLEADVKKANDSLRAARAERDKTVKAIAAGKKILLEFFDVMGADASVFRTSIYTAYVSEINNKRVVKIRPAKGLE